MPSADERAADAMPVECPRCGYDLSGEVARWVEACPLEGVCSECGLGFAWARLVSRERWRVRGFIEDARGRWRLFLWAWVTWLWTMLPPMFWKRVRLERPVRLSRVFLWLLIVYGTLHVAAALFTSGTIRMIALGARGWRDGTANRLVFNAWCEPVLSTVHAGFPTRWETVFVSAWPAGAWVLVGVSLAMPGVLLLLPWTRARAKVKSGHVARAAVYGLAWVVVPAAVKALVAVVVCAGFAMEISAGVGARTAGGRCAEWSQSVWYSFKYEWWGAWLGVGLAWLFYWWWTALKVGFRLERPGVVFLAMVISALLVGCIALCLSDDGHIFRWFA